jgi:DNA-binding response OmpR family regulator
MVVEDEALVALNEEAIVRDMTGADTTIVHTAAEAKVAAQSGSIDLALLDISLPDGNTFEVADVLRAHATPYIFVTAYGLNEIPLRHRSAPVVNKPFHEAELRTALTALLVPTLRNRMLQTG